jgi:hypothetical protein
MIAYKISKNARILFVGANPHPGSYRRSVALTNVELYLLQLITSPPASRDSGMA